VNGTNINPNLESPAVPPGFSFSVHRAMSRPLYHYTTGDRFLRIIASRAILPATAHVEPPEIPAVWLSSAPVWEPSATKGVIEDGIRRQATLAELIGLCGCLVRIEIDSDTVSLLEPDAFRDALCIPPDVHERLIAAGLEMGADPTDWRAVAGPVPLTAFRRIEFSIEAETPKWIPWPGIRLQAS
jgi:hypothetical protein